MRVAILVPRRDGQLDRDRSWTWVKTWWAERHPDWPIVEGHHNEGLFNRSYAINRAAEDAGHWDAAVIIDSDAICDPDRVRQATQLAVETNRLVLPYNVRKDLNHAGTRIAMSGSLKMKWDSYMYKAYNNTCSMVVVIGRRLWDEVGGFDEQFSGWGFEDSAFNIACETVSGLPMLKLPGDAWHLWHVPAKSLSLRTKPFEANRARRVMYQEVQGDVEKTKQLTRQGRLSLPAVST